MYARLFLQNRCATRIPPVVFCVIVRAPREQNISKNCVIQCYSTPPSYCADHLPARIRTHRRHTRVKCFFAVARPRALQTKRQRKATARHNGSSPGLHDVFRLLERCLVDDALKAEVRPSAVYHPRSGTSSKSSARVSEQLE